MLCSQEQWKCLTHTIHCRPNGIIKIAQKIDDFSVSKRSVCCSTVPGMSKYIVYDCDMGLDDAWGLLLLLRSNVRPAVEVLAVTCNFGNTNVDYVCSNVIRMLKALDSLHVSFPSEFYLS